MRRLLGRRGLDTDDAGLTLPDPVAEASRALAGISSASVLGRVALGPRAGVRVQRLGRESAVPCGTSPGPRRAHLEGFDLYLSLPVPADDRPRLEQLCRYLLRPPVAEDRLRLTADGRVLLELKSEWADGTSHLLFEPVELLEQLAALTRAPASISWFTTACSPRMPDGATAPSLTRALLPRAPVADSAVPPLPERCGETPSKPRYWAWADLMRCAFEIDVLACPRCGARMRVIATIEDPGVIRQILTHLGLPTEIPSPRPPPARAADLFSDTSA